LGEIGSPCDAGADVRSPAEDLDDVTVAFMAFMDVASLLDRE
jgi:hypothetical protein